MKCTRFSLNSRNRSASGASPHNPHKSYASGLSWRTSIPQTIFICPPPWSISKYATARPSNVSVLYHCVSLFVRLAETTSMTDSRFWARLQGIGNQFKRQSGLVLLRRKQSVTSHASRLIELGPSSPLHHPIPNCLPSYLPVYSTIYLCTFLSGCLFHHHHLGLSISLFVLLSPSVTFYLPSTYLSRCLLFYLTVSRAGGTETDIYK